MTKNCSYINVVTRNNRAVENMLNGNLESANEGFRECFVLLKECLAEESQHSSVDECGAALNKTPQHCRSLKLTASPMVVQRLQNEDFFVYNRPILFTYRTEGEADRDWVGTGQLLSSAVIFNMALLFHLKAHSTQNSKVMIKAQKLYLSVVKLADSTSERQLIHPLTTHAHKRLQYGNKWRHELGLAAMNNYTQLCHEMGELERAEQVAFALRSSLANVTRPGAFSRYEFDQIICNVLFLSLTNARTGSIRVPCAPAA
jgi:hypothetical protein